MIISDLPPGTTLFRAHTPQWASRPTSGAGAAGRDLVEVTDERLLFRRRVVVCDSRRFDTLLAVPL